MPVASVQPTPAKLALEYHDDLAHRGEPGSRSGPGAAAARRRPGSPSDFRTSSTFARKSGKSPYKRGARVQICTQRGTFTRG